MQPDQQRREALKKANRIRSRRAKFKRELEAGGVPAIEALLTRSPREDPEWLRGACIYNYVLLAPRVGATKLRKAYLRARVSQAITFENAPRRTRERLLDGLRTYAPKAFGR